MLVDSEPTKSSPAVPADGCGFIVLETGKVLFRHNISHRRSGQASEAGNPGGKSHLGFLNKPNKCKVEI